MNKKILLLEDDELLAQTIVELLEENSYNVDLAADGEIAAGLAYDNNYDLYIFDINVPEINGLDLLEGLRNSDDKTPTIFTTALIDMNSIARGFEVGADDYLKKPFFPQELLIRVDAKLGVNNSNFIYNDLEYDEASNILKKDGHILVLGEVQERLFKQFIENVGLVLDREILLGCLENPSPTALRVAITKLKQTTGLNIQNLRGIGYTLESS